MFFPYRALPLLAVITLVALCGCQQAAEQPQGEEATPEGALSALSLPEAPSNPVVVTVNGDEIRQSDLMRQMNLMSQQRMRVNPQQVLDQLIAERLLAQAAVSTGHVAAASEIQQTYDSIVAQAGGEATLEMQLAGAGTSPEELRKDLEQQLNVQAVVDWKTAGAVAVSDASLEAFYADNPQSFERAQARHILIRSAPTDSEEDRSKARQRTEAIAERLKAGEDFAEVAKEESEDPGSAVQGGDLGEFGRGRMVPSFDEAVFTLEPGTISDIIETQFGYHLIQVQERKTTPLEEVQDRLRQALENQQRQRIIRDWLAELEADATIEFTNGPPPGSAPPPGSMPPPGGSDAKADL